MKKVISFLLALILLTALVQPVKAEAPENPFTDVPEGAYYEDAVLWAYSSGIIGGMTETTFAPDANMRRAELWTTLARMKGDQVGGTSPWYAGAASWAAANGIASEDVDPLTDITRSELVTALYRLAGRPAAAENSLDGFTDIAELSQEDRDAMAWAAANEIIGGVAAGRLDPQGTARRGQVVTILWRYVQKTEKENVDSAPILDLADRSAEVEQMIAEAKDQFEAGDHTPLSEPVQYRVLWIGYTHVTYGELDFQMTDFDKEYLSAVTLNFEKVVEAYAGGNVDVTVDLYFEDAVRPLTKAAEEDWLYLSREAAQEEIDKYDAGGTYDTVLTTVQTQGSENEQRNQGKDGYGTYDVILGLKLQGIEDSLGYSTINLFLPKEGTYPLEDPAVPSLYATAVAVHEWLHQLEYLGDLLDIEYPDTHVYQGPENFPGYQKYTADQNNYDYFELYEQILAGTVPYSGDGDTAYVGMYPQMWRLVKRGTLNLGIYTVQSPDGAYLTGQAEEPQLTTSSEPSRWLLRYGGQGCFILIPEDIQAERIDLDNAWDEEGTIVKLFTPSSYVDAQRWRLTENGDGTFCIRTAYESQRALTVDGIGAQAVIQTADAPSDSQKWIFTCVAAY